jgi:predicted SAM-dependent methyltransferase
MTLKFGLEEAYRLARSMEARRRARTLEKEARARLNAFDSPHRLHLGCGEVNYAGWVNIDLLALPSVDVVWDVRRPFPLEDASCELIYHEHLLEHLTVQDAKKFLVECYRLLQPGGVTRIATPSLEEVTRKYNSTDWRNQDWLSRPEYRFIQTPAEMLNISLREWGHQWLYDREELHRRLGEAGFTKILDVEWRSSPIPELRNRETRPESLLICEAEK